MGEQPLVTPLLEAERRVSVDENAPVVDSIKISRKRATAVSVHVEWRDTNVQPATRRKVADGAEAER